MSKNLRSRLIILSLALMIVGGILTPHTAQARDGDSDTNQQQQSSIIWEASPEGAEQFQKLIQKMDVGIKTADAREARQLRAVSDMTLSEDQVSAAELASWVKVQQQLDQDDVERIIIIVIVTRDVVIIVIIF